MALLKENLYLRVEDIRIGKDVMQFKSSLYEDKTLQPIEITFHTVNYDLLGENPYIQAYKYLIGMEEFSDFVVDTIPEIVEETKVKKTKKKVK